MSHDSKDSGKADQEHPTDSSFTFQAMYRQFEKLNMRFDDMEDRFEKLKEESRSASKGESGNRRNDATPIRNTYNYEEYEDFYEADEDWRRGRNQGRGGQIGRGRFRGGNRGRYERRREEEEAEEKLYLKNLNREIRFLEEYIQKREGKMEVEGKYSRNYWIIKKEIDLLYQELYDLYLEKGKFLDHCEKQKIEKMEKMEKPINIFEQFFDSLKHNPESCKIKEVKAVVVIQDHEKNDEVIVPTIDDGEESEVVAENAIIEFKGEVMNDGGDVENTLDEMEEVNGAVLDVVKEIAPVPHELSITNSTLPSSFVFNVQDNVEFSKEEAFIIFPHIQKEFF
jgi:hypothetical protein